MTTARILRNITLAMLLPLAACAGDDQVSTQLQALSTCDDIVDRARHSAILRMEKALEYNFDCAVGGACLDGRVGGSPPGDANEDGGDGGDGGGDGASDHSETNNQVAGVDEADFVKNDANYLYIAANGALRIIDAWPAPEAHVVAEVEIEGTVRRLFVAEDRALVYSSLPIRGDGSPGQEAGWDRPRECTYGYDCSFTGDGRPTKITIFDLSDRAQPIVEREIWLSGSYVNARRIGAHVHTVISDPGPVFQGLKYWPENLSGSDRVSVARRAFDELRAENRAIILKTPPEQFLAAMREVIHTADGPHEKSHIGQCGTAYATSLRDGTAVTSVVSVSLAGSGDLSLTSIVSRPGAVYGSPAALYMAVPHEAAANLGWYRDLENEEQASSVHKFALAEDSPRVEYRGSGVVKGRVLNQFALDEYDGDLRVATTSGHAGDPKAHSTVTILRDSGRELAEIGRVDHIAPSEDIRSVRFDGDHGFIVTFKKTDPLFALDLTPPEAPRLVGELKIPGFSTYMHLMDDDHLLTIGYDASDQGDFAWFTGVLLQIFDVSDLTDPTLAHKEVIGTRGSSSDALTNHLAFNYYPTREALALPMTICEGGSENGGFGERMTFSGLMVYRVTPETGFSMTGAVSHPPGEEIGCGNWWTDAASQVKRSVFMEDFVFSISSSRVKVSAMEALASDLVEISLE